MGKYYVEWVANLQSMAVMRDGDVIVPVRIPKDGATICKMLNSRDNRIAELENEATNAGADARAWEHAHATIKMREDSYIEQIAELEQQNTLLTACVEDTARILSQAFPEYADAGFGVDELAGMIAGDTGVAGLRDQIAELEAEPMEVSPVVLIHAKVRGILFNKNIQFTDYEETDTGAVLTIRGDDWMRVVGAGIEYDLLEHVGNHMIIHITNLNAEHAGVESEDSE